MNMFGFEVCHTLQLSLPEVSSTDHCARISFPRLNLKFDHVRVRQIISVVFLQVHEIAFSFYDDKNRWCKVQYVRGKYHKLAELEFISTINLSSEL